MSTAVSIRGLVKSFPDFRLGPLDLDVETGSVVGLVGPNGAGKTTLLRCLIGLVRADEGVIEVAGRPAGAADAPLWKRDIGYAGEDRAFFDAWTGEENLRFLSGFYPRWSDTRARELADRFGLRLNQTVKSLSRGDATKLSLVAALAHSPKLLVLDEPTAGLDPVVRADFLETLWELQEDEERTILFSTHILSDVERLVGELAFLDRGQLLLHARTDELQEKWAQVYFRMPGDTPDVDGACDQRRDGDQHRVVSSNRESTLLHLEQLGAGDVRCFHMGVDEIAVAILRRARPLGELVT